MTTAQAIPSVQFKGLAEFEDTRLWLNFHPGQSRAWDSERRFVLVLAGTQGGKTSFGPWWLHREIERCGPGDYLAVTSTFDLFKLKMLPTLCEVFEQILGIGRYWSGDRVIELCDPATGKFLARRSQDTMYSRIILRSAEAKSGLESTTSKAAWLDECGQDQFTLEAWEAIQRRLSLAQGRALMTTTPYVQNWLKREVYDRWKAGDLDYDVIQFQSSQNPAFPRAEQERMRRSMPEWRYRMFYKGQFERPAGMIYDCFDDEIHVCPPFDIPSQWPRYVGVDFGGVNTALLWLAEEVAARRFVAYHESLEGGQTTKEHARQAKAAAAGVNFLGCWGGAKSEDQQRMDWTEAGFQIRQPPIWDVEAGISRVYGLLKEKRIRIFDTCMGLLDEIGSYRRKLDDKQEPTEQIEDKRKFHRLDALRYVAAGIVRPAGQPPAVAGQRTAIQAPAAAGGLFRSPMPGLPGRSGIR